MSVFNVLNFEIIFSNLLIWNNFFNHWFNLKFYQQASIIIKKDSIWMIFFIVIRSFLIRKWSECIGLQLIRKKIFDFYKQSFCRVLNVKYCELSIVREDHQYFKIFFILNVNDNFFALIPLFENIELHYFFNLIIVRFH